MLEVTLKRWFNLNAEEKDYAREDANLLRVTHNGKTILLECDGGEPEDASFFRDYSFVATAIRRAYELGKQDAMGDKEQP